jgi:hypothetical protein
LGVGVDGDVHREESTEDSGEEPGAIAAVAFVVEDEF